MKTLVMLPDFSDLIPMDNGKPDRDNPKFDIIHKLGVIPESAESRKRAH